jgi:hypothetical protein
LTRERGKNPHFNGGLQKLRAKHAAVAARRLTGPAQARKLPVPARIDDGATP